MKEDKKWAEYPEKSIGKPNPLMTTGSESDPELRH